MRATTINRRVPMPTPAQVAEAREYSEQRAQQEAQDRAAREAFLVAMRGRRVQILGTDGKFIYCRITRPTGSRIYKLNHAHPLTGAQRLFVRWACANGLNSQNLLHWSY